MLPSQKFSPTIIKANLIKASLFLTAYECLNTELVEKIISFYAIEFNDDLQPLESDNYNQKVLLLAKKGKNQKFNASCEWWKENGTLTPEDIQKIKKIRKQRNEIAHDLPQILFNSDQSINWIIFDKLKHYITILSRFWTRVTIDSHEEFDGIKIKDEELDKGIIILIYYIEEVIKEYISENE
jgi:hypothetical protein